MALQEEVGGAMPELALVLETVGSVEDFYKAVRRTPGMEWLVEWDEEDIDPDVDFYDVEDRQRRLSGKLFLVMTNAQAILELHRLWRLYTRDPEGKFPFGLSKWKQVFRQLRSIRFWDVQDRLDGSGIIEDWRERIARGEDRVGFEIELWFHSNQDRRRQNYLELERLVETVGGQLIAQANIEEIRYQAVLVQLPSTSIEEILGEARTNLTRSSSVMLFRPLGQIVFSPPEGQPSTTDQQRPIPEGDPIIALFDGFPLVNHVLLENRLRIDDPDNCASDYQAGEQNHGTAMASLILHGELVMQERTLSRPIYVRPIMKPDPTDRVHNPRLERVPEDVLVVDLIHRAVVRLFEGEQGSPPVSPGVKIINLSLGDSARSYDRNMSPWARLLDWLAWRYGVLFIVSAGNHAHDIQLLVPRQQFSQLTPDQVQHETIRAIHRDSANRRLLSPSESVNALTVGALHEDASTIGTLGHRVNTYQTRLPSPISALGQGYRRSIKPEILLPGGRQLFSMRLGNVHQRATLQVINTTSAPGQETASPGGITGILNATTYTRGTSNAAAIATRLAAQQYDALQALREEPGAETLLDSHISLVLKCLLVHSTSWDGLENQIVQAIGRNMQGGRLKNQVERFIGYGAATLNRTLYCTEQRATVISCSTISHDEGHIYSVPLPPSLSGQSIWRRLTITLAWFTPINPAHRTYRRASLWFDPPREKLRVERAQAHWQDVQRGTVQHEILEGTAAAAFRDGDRIEIKVSCKEDAGGLTEEVPYSLCVTLEVEEGIAIPIYQEIRARIRAPVRIAPQA